MWNGTALDLERKSGKHEHEAEQETKRRRTPAEGGGKAGEAHRSGKAIEQRDAVKQDSARERTKDEIFQPRLGRALIGAAVGGKHVAGEALQLEADVERDQARCRDHHAHADGGEDDQHRIFGRMLGSALEPAVRCDDRDGGRWEDDRLAEAREQVLGDEPVEYRPGMGWRADQRGRGSKKQRQRRASSMSAEPRRPAKAATSIRIVPPIDRMSSGRERSEAGISALLRWFMCIAPLPSVSCESPAGATRLEPGRSGGRRRCGSAEGNSPDRCPSRRPRARSARGATTRAGSRSGIAAASACARVPKQMRQ